MLITQVVGARPNFMKAAPVIAALQKLRAPQQLVHTGLARILPQSDAAKVLKQLGISASQRYVLVTHHRPATVDDPQVLEGRA